MTTNSNDLRVRRTKRLLQGALIELIEEKGFVALTVGEITQRAMVSRAAFYRYYRDKFEMVERIIEEAVQNLTDEIGQPSQSLADFEHRVVSESWVKLFEHFASYDRLYRVLLGGTGSTWFATKMRTYFTEVVKEHVCFPGRTKTSGPVIFDQGLISTLISAMFVDTIRWWLENGIPYTPRQLAMNCALLASSMLKEVSSWE